MNELISPKYQMKLVKSVHDAIWEEYKSYKEVSLYIEKWYEGDQWNNNWENFHIFQKENGEIDLLRTLHSMAGSDLLKVAIDMGVDTPDFIPSIPTFKNELKSTFKTAYDTFSKAFKQIETDPSLAIGLASSALESIIKEILKDERINSKVKGTETLYKLTTIILKEFNIVDSNHPVEIKTIGSSLLAICQSIEKLRSEKTDFHGKTSEDYLINDTVFTYFVVNSVTTVGLFLNSYFKTKFPKPIKIAEEHDDLPF
ncbi:abortive infection family protein [Bizionia paragorgiae]|uniref:Abortive infection C-terminus n=1 Tax=Bizionia paragorgiae TaxID=283786 RepID=A0A1H4DES8_BIZPA|nr:abortive infection family protein [Bizionia paragorgiae]SEA70762.1 Abortive infection C-terminus [Bizionia paragorgiae]